MRNERGNKIKFESMISYCFSLIYSDLIRGEVEYVG